MVLREFEFNNRIAAQRRLLRTVNRTGCWCEQLAGISIDAIERFARMNELSTSDEVVVLLRATAKRLQCLATKSQEQITEEYANIGREVDELQRKLATALEKKGPTIGASHTATVRGGPLRRGRH